MNVKKEHRRAMEPAKIIAASFFAIIALGTFLFTLPFMTRDGEGLSFMQALFTATSGVCVTGLTLIDPAVTLSRYGQILLALLIETGGISTVTFASFFLFALKKKSSLKTVRLAQEYTNLDHFSEVKSLVRVIIVTAFLCQAVGACILCIRFVPAYGAKGIWLALFTAISAYCNAGFDIFGFQKEFGSLSSFNGDILVMGTVMALIILGGIGFFVVYDIVRYRKDKHLSLHTKVMLVFTLLLIVFGFAVFFIAEYTNEATLGSMPLKEKIIAALFQSVTSRTAGFTSVDIASMRDISKIVMMLLMFIGAGSGSTAGGIKVTTFAIIMMSVVSVVRNRDETIVFGHRVDRKSVSKSLSIAVLGLMFVFVTCCILFIDNPNTDGINVFFEALSAFGTAGITCGVTASVGILGQLALIITMFIGRLGPICFVIALNIRGGDKSGIIRPEGRIMVG